MSKRLPGLFLLSALARPARVGAGGAALQAAAEEEGVIARAIGDSLCVCPPLIITADQVNAMFDAVGRALDAVAKRDRWKRVSA